VGGREVKDGVSEKLKALIRRICGTSLVGIGDVGQGFRPKTHRKRRQGILQSVL
jgi:hypothetical protein